MIGTVVVLRVRFEGDSHLQVTSAVVHEDGPSGVDSLNVYSRHCTS